MKKNLFYRLQQTDFQFLSRSLMKFVTALCEHLYYRFVSFPPPALTAYQRAGAKEISALNAQRLVKISCSEAGENLIEMLSSGTGAF